MPVDHYENFPVASWLLPKHLRQPIEIIYQFARSADDFADEGDLPVAARLARLGGYQKELDCIETRAESTLPLFSDLAGVIRKYDLPLQLFHDLLDAFTQDVTKTRYADFAELLEYCRRSANPIGKLLLHLNFIVTPQNLAWSDSICTALQLINHWQDVAIDWQKNGGGRVYLPQDELAQFGLADRDIANQICNDAWQNMMAFQCTRARNMMEFGRPLGRVMPGRMGVELRMMIAGGLVILDKIEVARGDVFRHRPRLNRWDWLKIAPRALIPT